MGNETVRNRQEVPAEDPLAELARLMGQEDEFADLLRQSEAARRPAAPAPQSAAPRPQPYAPAPRPAVPRNPEPGRPTPGSFAALAAEVYSEGAPRPAAPTPRHPIEDAAREANRSFSRPEAPAPRPSSPPSPEARSAEPRAPYVPPRPQPIEPPRRPPVAPSPAAAGEAVARAPMASAGESMRPAPRPEAPRAQSPRADTVRPEAPRPPQRADVPQEPAEAETRLPSWMARAAANNAEQAAARAPAQGAPAAPAPAAGRAAAPQARHFDLDEDAYDYGRSAADYEGGAGEVYEDDLGTAAPERRGRRRLLLIGGLMVAAIAVTAGAYVVLMRPQGASGPSGEPPVIRAEQGPNKVTPAQPAQEQQASDGQKLIYDRVGGNATTGNEQVVSSEEQPVDVSQAAQPQQPRVIQTTPSQSSAPANSAEPKRVRTLTVRADGTVVPDDAAPTPTPVAPTSLSSSGQSAVSTPIPLNTGTGAPVSTNPTPLAATPSIVDNVKSSDRVAAAPTPAPAAAPAPAPAAPAASPAAAPATAVAGAYVVQIASVRSEAEAQATWRSMQGKYPGLLSNQPFTVKRADLGDRGVYYRAQVGSFSGREDAVKLCEALRAQGGDCMVQRN